MSTFKKAKVVMLPTNQKTKYLMVYSDVEKTKGKLILNGLKNDEYKEYQHLYIISDDEIKEGDWFYNIHSKIVGRAAFNSGKDELAKKIIATTTDTSLYIHQKETVSLPERVFYLPQPSQQFIQKFVEEYNKGNVITDVLVEYEVDKVTMACTCTDSSIGCPFSYYDGINECCRKRFPNGEYWDKTFKVKINPKDNTITIKKVKEIYTKEEVISLCDSAYKVGYGTAVCEETNQGKEVSFKEWLSTSILDIEPNKTYTKEEVISILAKYLIFLWSEVGIHYPISLGNDVTDTFINRELPKY